MPSNRAAWLNEPKAKPFEVKESEYVAPEENQVRVKNAAVAINPIDWKLQDLALYPIQYPGILGQDVAGEVVEVGPGVTRFKVGDRVLGHALGMMARQPSQCGFQEYTILTTNMASQIPSSISYEAACVLPLGLSTACSGMYQENWLNLQLPTPDAKPTGEVVLVWGGSSSVGTNAVQLARNSGYEVIATASSKNFDLVKKLGADHVFDYGHKDVVDEILSALKGKKLAGVIDCINTSGAFMSCFDVAAKAEGTHKVTTVGPIPENLSSDAITSRIFGTDIKKNHIGAAIYEKFLPEALEKGKFVPAPEPFVAGKGVESIQDAVATLKKGVSAKKVIVTL